ncbi:MAG: NADH-quinone oxidoreductase subunit M [Fibromonadaceae bacterium]|jgi:NADH-quinone oxidoreductase subunit M|nr:NADH-quinone oxidoreductase subunit M [Fibromonadaceae bacterium]
MLISFLLILPFAFSCLMLAASSRDVNSSFRIGLFCTAVPFVLATALVMVGGQQTPSYAWFSVLGINVEFSLYGQGFSLWMAWLAALLSFLAYAYFKGMPGFEIKKFTIGLLVLEGTIIGAFLSAQNMVQFLFFFEAMVLPAAILMTLHGGLKRRRAVVVFTLYTLIGSVPLLFGAWYLMLKAGSDNINVLAETLKALPLSVQITLLLAFSLAFAVKTPIFPFHSWQGITYSEAPYPLSAILSGAMSKVGVFGFAIWVIQIFWNTLQTSNYDIYFIAIALFSMLYSAVLALRQTNVKKLLAFSSMSHLSLAVAGLFCFNGVVDAGVAVMLVGHGLTAGGLFFLSGIVQKWTGSTNLNQYGAFVSTNPIYAAIFGFVSIAAVSVPCTVGFVGEFLILQGFFYSSFPFFALVGGVGIICSAAYMLRLIKSVLFGPVPENSRRAGISLSFFEGAAAIPIILFILYFGLHPAPILNSFGSVSTNHILTEQEMQEFKDYLEGFEKDTLEDAGDVD